MPCSLIVMATLVEREWSAVCAGRGIRFDETRRVCLHVCIVVAMVNIGIRD